MIKMRTEAVTLVDVDELLPNPKNPNKHGADQIDRLAKIIEYQGFRDPIIVSNQSGFIVSGHGRLMAAKQMGLKSVPVAHQDFDDPAQEYAAMVSENAIASWSDLDLSIIHKDILEHGPDLDLDLLGIKNFEFEKLARHRLMCGDSTSIDAVDRLTAGKKPDMAFTDPPYGIGFKYNSHQDITGEDYKDFCRDWFSVLKIHSDFIVISTGWAYNLFWYQQEPKDTFYWICKNKRTGGSISHFRKVEPLFIWGKPAQKYDFDFFEQTHQIEQDLKGQHSCPKPVSLIEGIIAGCSEGGTVLDVFGGSGTTMIAAEKTGRASLLMEIDPNYCDVILQRWAEFTKADPVRDDGVKWSDLVNEL
jgi:DNA modification methylase